MGYFHYPIDDERETIAKMVEHFPIFCENINKGDFNIVCAMGLNRTDIALCIYLMVYATDKGIVPPEIRCNRNADGYYIGKIMSILNALYKY